MLANAFQECQRGEDCVRVGLLANSRLTPTDGMYVWSLPKSFPHLWKKLWKFECFAVRQAKTLMNDVVSPGEGPSKPSAVR